MNQGQLDAKMLGALLTGVNRAFPFLKGKNVSSLIVTVVLNCAKSESGCIRLMGVIIICVVGLWNIIVLTSDDTLVCMCNNLGNNKLQRQVGMAEPRCMGTRIG